MSPRRPLDIARLYHLGSSHERATLVPPILDEDRAPARFRTIPGAPRTPLPGRDFDLPMPLGEALERRRSIREYAAAPIPFSTLGRLLHTSYGVHDRPPDPSPARPAPSAGGRYPLEIYAATQSVEGLGDAIYHYDARDHALELLRPGLAQPALVDLIIGQEAARDAGVVLIITAVRERTMWKYGQRGYRHILLDAGHVGQNIYLVATALGLGATAIGGFFDADLGALLELPEGEEAMYVLLIGKPRSHEEAPCPGCD